MAEIVDINSIKLDSPRIVPLSQVQLDEKPSILPGELQQDAAPDMSAIKAGPVSKEWQGGIRTHRALFETGMAAFSGLYSWPARKVAGYTTHLMTGDLDAAKAVEQGVFNELLVKPKTQEGEYITNNLFKLVGIPFEITGEVGSELVDLAYLTPFHPVSLTREEAKYYMEGASVLATGGAFKGLFKVAKEGIPKGMEDMPQFLKELTGRGKAYEELKKQKEVEKLQKEKEGNYDYQDFKDAVGIREEPEAKSLWNNFQEYLLNTDAKSEAFESWMKKPDNPLFKESERGSFSTEKEKPLLHEFPEDINERWKAAIPEQPTLWERGRERLNEFYDKATRVYEHLPNTPEFAPLKFELLNLQKYKGIASDKAARGLKDIVDKLDRPLYDLFEKKVIVDDLFYCAEKGMDLPYGFTPERLAAEKIILDDLVAKNPLVDGAIAKRKARWDTIKNDYVDVMERIGLNVKDRFKNEDYYHHQVLEYAKANQVYGTSGKLKTPANRGFLKKREGSELDISRDYLQVEHDVQSQMIHDIKVAEVIDFVDKNYNQAPKLKAEAKLQEIEDWKTLIPEGSNLYQPREGNVFYMTQSVPTKIANELMSGALEEFGITAEHLKPVLAVGGPRREFVLKQEIIDTIENLAKKESDNIVSRGSRWLMSQWKEKVALINPRGLFKYNFRNLSGDAEAAFVGNPSAFKKSSQSFKELYRAFFGDKEMSADLKDFFDMGGFEGTMQAIEMKSFGELDVFKHLYDKNKNISDIPKTVWDKYWKTARLSTDLREGILRYAAYKDYLEQMKSSPDGLPKNWGASVPEEIKALGDIKKRAFWLQDDLLGAYDKVSVLGQHLRTHIWPFWSWKEVNARRYIQLWKNAWDSGEIASMTGRQLGAKAPLLAYKIGKFAIKTAGLMALLEVYNHTFFKEEEELLPENVKKTAHINFGRDKDGNVIYFDRLGILQDFLSNFGLDQSGRLAKKVLNGDMTIKEAATEMAKGPLNVIAQGIAPWWKVPAEFATGKSLYPDVTKPGTIRDKKLYIARQLKLGDEYTALAGLPSEGYDKSLKKLFVYSSNPGMAAYSDIMDEKRRFAERNGKEGEGFFITPKGNALYNYKLALRYKDFKSAEHYLDDYIAKGGTAEGFSRSMQSMNPLYGMNPMDRMQFVSNLNEESMKKLERAMEYYLDVLSHPTMEEPE